MNEPSLPEREERPNGIGDASRQTTVPRGNSRSESDEQSHPGYYGNGLLTRPQIDYLAWLFTGGLYKPRDW